MDQDFEDALLVASEAYQRRLEEKKQKSRQTRSFCEDPSLISYTSTSCASFSPVDKNTQIFSASPTHVDIPHHGSNEIYPIINELNLSSDDDDSVSVVSDDSSDENL